VMKPRLRAEWMVLSEELCILSSCCLSPVSMNLVLEELGVKRLAYIFVFTFHRNYVSVLYRFRDVASYLLKVTNFAIPGVFDAPVDGDPLAFHQDVWHQKARLPSMVWHDLHDNMTGHVLGQLLFPPQNYHSHQGSGVASV